MLAVRLYGPRRLRVERVSVPEPPGGWVLVRTVAVGVCGTDKSMYTGGYRLRKTPLIPGHEAVGVVVSAPPEYRGLVGRLVVPEINLVKPGDLWREPCRSMYTHCPGRRVLGIDYDGAMAEYFAVPGHVLHPVSGLEPLKAVFVEPLAAVLRAFTLYPPRPGAYAAVIGSGNLALLAAQVMERVYRLRVTVFARRGSPKARVLESMGLRVRWVDELAEVVASETPWGMGYEVVFEATGSSEGLKLAVEAAAPMATVHVKSTHGGGGWLDTTRAVVKELRIVGSRCGTWREFEAAIELLRGRVVEPVVTHRVRGLENALEAFEKALERGSFKVVLETGYEPSSMPGVP
ncbi:alcohol dehydrogenase GroES domain containing protein [Pyrodictium delaneyi]|uniref:Alcohol dehydrogenase GroES domain containing protein n=1 Tax=Pyrodictium delaneyi TaxID=1273541 RepID=A0A0P0N1E9_9CREN|nr:alcohol dehydrogenase catalytic domain-containing protein [Pyrodictium delaneyi]ALL00372.1 alcohol dehydrogenase GroES domain containing protein [Pyrodictium delaneyi]